MASCEPWRTVASSIGTVSFPPCLAHILLPSSGERARPHDHQPDLMTIKGMLAGFLAEKQSVGTGVILALIAWTLTRLVDGITGSGTIEYDVSFAPATLASGEPGDRIEVELSNLSKDISVTKLRAVISDPRGATTFGKASGDYECAYEPPAWASDGTCQPDERGMTFEAPMLVPGTHARVAVKYTQVGGTTHRPIVRIRPGDGSNFQLVGPGLRTFIVRHEVTILMVLLASSVVLLFMSVSAMPMEAKHE